MNLTHNLYACSTQCMPTYVNGKGKGKGKASSLDIAPLTILNSGTLQPQKWQLTGNDCSTCSGSPEPTLMGYWAHSCSKQAYYAPVNHARSSPRNPCT